MSTTGTRRGDRTWLVAIAVSMWGISSLWRGPRAREYRSLTIVFWEHLVLTLFTLWWLVPGVPDDAHQALGGAVSADAS